jgi:hypothetical protein
MAWHTDRPETVRLENATGDWIVVKKRLTAGERHDQLAMLTTGSPIDELKVNRLKIGISKMVAYLVDWSVTDPDGKRIEILYQPPDAVERALRDLPQPVFTEILELIDKHDDAVDAARSAEKNGQAGETGSSPDSPLPDSLAGGTSGSVN